MSNESIYTLAVHAGEDREANHGALSIPIYNASVYAFTDAEDGAAIHNEFKHGYYYGRLGNPTTEALERTIAELESAEANLRRQQRLLKLGSAHKSDVTNAEEKLAELRAPKN
jgi:O-acetylhomoserine/O-acetylserine sulfhydrylase-like pyridoxal-dependent enzyme